VTEHQEIENREKFLHRLYTPPGSVLFSEEESARIEMAYDLAKHAHRWQKRKDGTRYFEHPRRVALHIIDGVGLYDFETVVVGLLHDGYEDVPKIVSPLKVKILAGEGAARKLRLVSKVPKEDYVERLRKYADWQTLTAKLCDRYDNYDDLETSDEAFQRKQTIETRDVYMPLFEYLTTIAPAPYKDNVVCMVEKLAWMVRQRAAALGLEG
jgi:guanosine-3',5'-bis(diphosphate) 3'-pyrophosphohydrolase